MYSNYFSKQVFNILFIYFFRQTTNFQVQIINVLINGFNNTWIYFRFTFKYFCKIAFKNVLFKCMANFISSTWLKKKINNHSSKKIFWTELKGTCFNSYNWVVNSLFVLQLFHFFLQSYCWRSAPSHHCCLWPEPFFQPLSLHYPPPVYLQPQNS